MRITLITFGSRGDVQPYVALGVGLKAAGHTVSIATHGIYADFIRRFGLGHFPLEGNPQAVLEQEMGKAFIGSGRNPLAMLKHLSAIMEPLFVDMTRDSLAACQDADFIIVGSLSFYPAYGVLEKLDIPFLAAYLQPIHSTRHFAASLFPPPPSWMPGKSFYNRFSHRMVVALGWRMFHPAMDNARAEVLDMPPMQRTFNQMMRDRFPMCYGFSPALIPRPDEWPEWVDISGYWFLDEDNWEPPADLLAFLEAGEPPVSVGFGSMTDRDPAQMTRLVVEALRLAGKRAVLLSGWAGIGQIALPDTIFCIDSAPHGWLFPRMAAVVHHGGAGTTAAGLRAGVPSVVVPFFGDQSFWGQRVVDRGAGMSIQRKHLTAEKLAAALHKVTADADIRGRAAALGEAIRAEDGVARVVERVEKLASAR